MRRPLIFLLIALIAGIMAGSYFSFPYDVLLSVGAFILILIFLSIRKKWMTAGFLLVVIFFILFGIFDIQKQFHFKDNRNGFSYIDQGKIIMEGIITESPIVYPDKNILIVRCVRIINNKSYIPASCMVRLVIPPDLNFQYGDFIRFQSTIRDIHNFNNPGGFDYKLYLNRQGIYASCFITDKSDIVLIRHKSLGGIRLKLESFRNYLKQIIHKNASSPQREIIEAMTIGNQNEIPAEVRDNFTKTGTSHILSISGLHIGMVSAFAFFFAYLILKSSEYLMLRFNIIKLAAVASFLMVLIYAFIAGMGVTVMRSALMALIFLIALISGKQKDLYNTLALAGLIILCVSPEALFDISFQLSFLAVLAIICVVPRLNYIPSEKISNLPLWTQGIIRYAYTSLIVCVAATIGTLPLIMYYFNRVSIVTIFANLIAVPLLGTITLGIAMFFILFSFLSPAIAGYFIRLASFFTQISIDIINKMAALEWSSVRAFKPYVIEIAFYYLLIYLIFQFIESKQKIIIIKDVPPRRLLFFKYLLIITAIFFISDIIYFSLRDKFSSDLRITVIDVGQGSSILIRFPGGGNMLVDGGGFSESSFDTGKAVIAPFLYHERISHLDTVVLSHPHPDHLLGLLYIMDNFNVRKIWKSYLPINAEDYPQWEKSVRINNIENVFLSNKSPGNIFSGVQVKILWPPEYSVDNTGHISDNKANDFSLVLKITYGGISFLLPADISSTIEKQLMESGADLKSDVLIVPHHGSNQSSNPDFIKAVSCHWAVVSAGKSNMFKHPHPSVIQRYKDAGVKIIRTDQDGAIDFTTDGNNLHLRTFIQDK